MMENSKFIRLSSQVHLQSSKQCLRVACEKGLRKRYNFLARSWNSSLSFGSRCYIFAIILIYVCYLLIIFRIRCNLFGAPQMLSCRCGAWCRPCVAFEPDWCHRRKIAYFIGKTTYSNMKFDIIDPNKLLIQYLFFICRFVYIYI